MNAVATRQEVGDYDLRGRGIDDALIAEVTPSLGDASRMVRAEWRNGFPNWELYRTALAGDDIFRERVREWVVAFTLRVAQQTIRSDAYSEEFACVAGWDALHILTYGRELQPYTVTAAAVDVHPDTYRRLRDLTYRLLRATLDEYWMRLGIAYRYVLIAERKA